MHEQKPESSYIKQCRILAAGLRRATEKNNLEQISKYESLIEILLTELAGKKIPAELGLALKKLKQQHQQTSASIARQLEEVKHELSNLKKSKKRMKAYSTSSSQHIVVKA